MSAIAERVAAGAAFLDEHDPDWWKPDVECAIDLGHLNLAWPERGVHGQRCPLEVLRGNPGYASIQRGWTEREWASRDYGVTVTGAPRWAGPAPLPLPESAPEALRDTTGTAYADWPTGGFRAADAALAKGEMA